MKSNEIVEKAKKLKVGECREIESDKGKHGERIIYKLCRVTERQVKMTPLRVVNTDEK